MNPCKSYALISLVLLPTFAYAELGPIIVTPTRTAQTTNETLASVTIITRDDIEKQQATSVQDLLRTVPGLDITNSGGAGKTTSIFMRGTQSDHVLVLIDGIKVGSATLGTTPFQHLPVSQIERIEIVRGPRSSLYGSEAIGGVIQIFTRKGNGEQRPYFSIGTGSFQTRSLSAGVSGGSDNSWYSINASSIDTDGFNACNGTASAGCWVASEPDDDGYSNQSVSIQGGYRFTNDVELELHALQSDNETEFDGSFQNSSESLQQIIGTRLRFSPTKIWHLNLAFGNSVDESDNFFNGTFTGRFDTERETISWQNDLQLSPTNLLTLGVDYQDDKIDSDTNYNVTSRDNKGVFAQYLTSVSGNDIQLSARRDDNEQFGGYTTGGLSIGRNLGKSLRFSSSYASAFKAPTFNELYYPAFGNPDLDPEKATSFEISLSDQTGLWAVSIYDTEIENLIAFDSTTFLPGNVSKAKIRGIESTLSTQIATWDINASLTLLDARDESGDFNDGNLLPRRAEESLSLSADHQLDGYSYGITLLAVGDRYNDLANNTLLESYTTVDLRMAYSLSKEVELQARVENLFDEDYETAELYNQPERSLYLTLRYQP